jgi:hypothetical protein
VFPFICVSSNLATLVRLKLTFKFWMTWSWCSDFLSVLLRSSVEIKRERECVCVCVWCVCVCGVWVCECVCVCVCVCECVCVCVCVEVHMGLSMQMHAHIQRPEANSFETGSLLAWISPVSRLESRGPPGLYLSSMGIISKWLQTLLLTWDLGTDSGHGVYRLSSAFAHEQNKTKHPKHVKSVLHDLKS